MDPNLFQISRPRVSALQNIQLTAIPDPVVIRSAVFGPKSSGSLGSDGFLGSFIYSCWDTVGDSVIAAGRNFFFSKRLLKASNSSFITLIPKSTAPSFSDYWPISLLNFIYTVISKILATRMATILPHLVSLHQVASIKWWKNSWKKNLRSCSLGSWALSSWKAAVKAKGSASN